MFLAVFTPSESNEVSPDAALVNRLLQRDVSAFEDLYDRHSRVVYALVLRVLQQASTAEEVVQDVFLQLWRNAAQYDGSRGPFVPWLLTLARNRALDQLRLKSERQRRREDQAEELSPVVAIPDFEGFLDEKRRATRVRELVASLNPKQKRAIELAYLLLRTLRLVALNVGRLSKSRACSLVSWRIWLRRLGPQTCSADGCCRRCVQKPR